jgi:hypothetical protein
LGNPPAVGFARLPGTYDAAEAPVGHDAQVLALFIMTILGAGGAAGDDLAAPLAHVLKLRTPAKTNIAF